MILSDKQHLISRNQLTKMHAAILEAEQRTTEQEWLKRAEIDALRSQISELESEIAEYELIKSGQITFSKTYALEDLSRVLVQARIASGMSQTDLAKKLDMKPQQIQRYEATNYMGASLARLIEVSKALNVKASGTFEGESQVGGSLFLWSDASDIVWSQFPYKEMIKRKWFNLTGNANPLEKVKEYFLHAAGPQFATAFHRKKMRSENAPNEYALLAWQARVLERAREKSHSNKFTEFRLNDSWLPDLVRLTKHKDGPKLACNMLAQKGITLIIEPHLPGSYLDGAAMLDENERPVIGLTLRHDRLDNFWFVLFHELGHIYLHLYDRVRYDFFDEEGSSDNDNIETDADKFALNALIPDALWDQCLSRFALSDESVVLDANSLGIDPSIIAGRIRMERRNYTILGNLVGQGQIRKQFEEPVDDLD